jgi:hypothetical protein
MAAHETMQLSNILSDLRNVGSDGVTKTASARSSGASQVPQARDELLAVLGEVNMSSKTAAAAPQNSAVAAVEKIASDLATGESAAIEKEAHFYGSAIADGFMSRIGQYEQASGGVKTASGGGIPTEAEFEKFAAENPELTKQAMDLGYRDGRAQVQELEKTAFAQGYNDTVAQIGELSKTAAGREKLAQVASQVRGDDMQKVAVELDAWSKTAEGAEAMPYVRQGYQDTTEKIAEAMPYVQQGYQDTTEKIAEANRGYAEAATEINKIASVCFNNGFNQTVGLLQNLSA